MIKSPPACLPTYPALFFFLDATSLPFFPAPAAVLTKHLIAPQRYLELPIEVKDKYKKKIKGGTPIVAVGIEGPAVLDYASLRRRCSSWPGALFNDLDRRLYLPQADGCFYLGVEYEK